MIENQLVLVCSIYLGSKDHVSEFSPQLMTPLYIYPFKIHDPDAFPVSDELHTQILRGIMCEKRPLDLKTEPGTSLDGSGVMVDVFYLKPVAETSHVVERGFELLKSGLGFLPKVRIKKPNSVSVTKRN